MASRLLFVVLAFALAGCSRIEALNLAPHEKVTAAFALASEAETARRRLDDTLQSMPEPARPRWTQTIDELVRTRSQTCSAAVAISRFDTVEAVRARITDAGCFQAQDKLLAQRLQVRRLRALLAREPLRPMQALKDGAEIPAASQVALLDVAESADVAAVKLGGRDVMVVDLQGGPPNARFAIDGNFPREMSLSPNGRVLAVQGSDRRLRVYDAGSGELLWDPEAYRGLQWLPGLEAVALNGAEKGTPALLNLRTEATEIFLPSTQDLSWAVPVPKKDGRFVFGAMQAAFLVDIQAGPEGALTHEIVRRWKIEAAGMRLGPPMLMQQGRRLAFFASPRLNWLDLESGEQGGWDLGPLVPFAFAKAGDAQVVFTPQSGDISRQRPMLLDLDTGMVSDGVPGPLKYPLALGRRVGAVANSNEALVLRTRFEGTDPRAVEGVVAEAQLQQQLMLARRAAERAEAAAFGGSPTQEHQGAAGGRPRATLVDVPADARVAAVGLYQAPSSRPATPGSRERRGGTVRIHVAKDSTPLVLVLSSYEPVTWMVLNPSARKIAAVLVSGYHESRVIGDAQTPPATVLGRHHAHELGGAGYQALQQDVANAVGKPIGGFQGRYEGTEFIVR